MVTVPSVGGGCCAMAIEVSRIIMFQNPPAPNGVSAPNRGSTAPIMFVYMPPIE